MASSSPALPPFAPAFAALAPRYDLILCDVWGVLHNGVEGRMEAAEALTRARENGATVILISNAPRPNAGVATMLAGMRIPVSWDAIVTSGDVTAGLLRERGGGRLFHLGPDRDLPIYDGIEVELVGPEDADLVVCTGLFDDTVETPEDYRSTLAAAKARELPFICANPDIVVERGGDLIWCAGALAEAYEALGGEVVWCGKPHLPIYEAALALAQRLRGAPVARERVVAIGDALRTDLAGALNAGIDCLFVAAGIHAGELGLEAGAEVDLRALARLLEDGPGQPAAVTTRLVW
ncbi:TIGR01459 family HAD-type hydrolase [Bosea sp. 117]|uniref:TIGR01459 family HAD-type hydrolase n=1 Tax=Bosea sp. 117 TaxID=1125973 RepID=UPI0004949AEC|nr:TIGR01459 family HAD-type hydrolase [Bosea sp. 117]